MTIGDKIKLLRVKQDMTQNELAKKANISRVSVGNYERDDRVPNIHILSRIANALGVTINDLAGINKIEEKTDSTFKEAFSQFIADKRYLLDAKESYDSIEEYNECLEALYNATIEYIEFYCFKLK